VDFEGLIMVSERISEKVLYPSKFIEVCGSKMHYLEAGQGDPILFLHGIPTSSYLWRNIIPVLAPLGRCIAPDLIGLGLSDKPDIQYTLFDHIKYVEEFINVLQLKNVVLIMHGWGSLIGFDYAMRHENNCRGLVFYEAFLRPIDHDNISLAYQEQLLSFSEQTDLVQHGTAFVDQIIPQTVMRQLSNEEMDFYRRPFKQEGAGKAVLQYLKELPKGDNQGKIDQFIAAYSEKLQQSKLSKLMLYSVPGFIMTIATIMWAKKHLKNLEITEIGEELHLGQESYPQLMGETISAWLQAIEQSR
jgi:haloalkane dehalogenase